MRAWGCWAYAQSLTQEGACVQHTPQHNTSTIRHTNQGVARTSALQGRDAVHRSPGPLRKIPSPADRTEAANSSPCQHVLCISCLLVAVVQSRAVQYSTVPYCSHAFCLRGAPGFWAATAAAVTAAAGLALCCTSSALQETTGELH